MNHLRWALIPIVVLSAASFTGCNGSESAWSDVISKCAGSQIINNTWTYLGVTNTAGLGSVWRKDNQGLSLRFDPARHLSPGQLSEYEQEGNAASCVGEKTVTWSLKPEYVLGPEGTKVSEELKADLDKATVTKVSVDQFRVDNIEELSYLTTLKKASGDYWTDITNGDRYVINSVVWISGLAAHLSFDTKIGGQLHAKYPDGVPLTVGLSSRWASATDLEIDLSKGSSIIAGRLVPFPDINESSSFAGAAPAAQAESSESSSIPGAAPAAQAESNESSSIPGAAPAAQAENTEQDTAMAQFRQLQIIAAAMKQVKPVSFEHVLILSKNEEVQASINADIP